MPYTLSDTPATTAISFGPEPVLTLPAINGGKRLCIWRGWLSVWIFQRSFMSLTLSVVRIVSLRCQAVRWGSPPSVNQSALRGACAPGVVAVQAAAAQSARLAERNRRFISGLRQKTRAHLG